MEDASPLIPLPQLLELGAILALGGLLAWGAIVLLRALRGPDRQLRRAASAAIWLGLCTSALLALPGALRPAFFPSLTVRALAPALCLPWWLLELGWLGTRAEAALARGLRVAVPAGVLLLVSAVVRGSLALRPTISEVDFYEFVCFGRDLALGPGPLINARFLYFPGSFRFFQAAILLGADDLPKLQGVFLGVIFAMAAAVAVLATRGWSDAPEPGTGPVRWTARIRGVLLGLTSFALTLLLLPGLEGYTGSIEVIAVLPALLGLAAWSGAPLSGLDGFARAGVLGIGLALATFVKQQAGLLSLGWVALLPFAVGRRRQHHLGTLLVVPAAAATTLCVLFALDGGWDALKQGLSQATGYVVTGGFVTNVLRVYPHAWMMLWPALLLFTAWLLFGFLPSLRGMWQSTGHQLAGFCLLGGFASLLQLRWRPYLHYLLLTLPFLVAGCFVAGRDLLGRLGPRTLGPLTRPLPALALVFLLARAASLLPVDVLSLGVQQVPSRDWPDAQASQDLDHLRQHVRPGEDLLVLPSRRNAAHYRLGTRTDSWPLGYIWPPREPGEYPRFIRARRPLHVLVLTGLIAPAHREDWANCLQGDCAGALRALPESGYRVVAQLPTMTLWRREP